jgi:FkbM family methyltransferase
MKNYHNVIVNKTNINVKKILEIGSRDGNDANYLKKLFGLNDKDVWVVEPNPIKIKEIKEKYPNINLVESAISNTEGEHYFNQVVGDDVSAGTSSLIDRADDWYEKTKTNKIIVNTIRGEKLLDIINHEIDICKIDVEGLTYEVLESFNEKLSYLKSLHIECEHKEVWKNQKLYEEIKDFLIKKNFIEIYFSFTSDYKLQSDSIWVYKDYLKI